MVPQMFIPRVGIAGAVFFGNFEREAAMCDEALSSREEREKAARRKVEHKRLDERGLPKDTTSKGRPLAKVVIDTDEAPDSEPPPIPAEEVTEPNPKRIGER